MSRLFIYNKDVQVITGKGRNVATRIMAEIRAKYNKAQKDFVSITEFCEHANLDVELVLERLK